MYELTVNTGFSWKKKEDFECGTVNWKNKSSMGENKVWNWGTATNVIV